MHNTTAFGLRCKGLQLCPQKQTERMMLLFSLGQKAMIENLYLLHTKQLACPPLPQAIYEEVGFKSYLAG